jgi:hypothetical protein
VRDVCDESALLALGNGRSTNVREYDWASNHFAPQSLGATVGVGSEAAALGRTVAWVEQPTIVPVGGAFFCATACPKRTQPAYMGGVLVSFPKTRHVPNC